MSYKEGDWDLKCRLNYAKGVDLYTNEMEMQNTPAVE